MPLYCILRIASGWVVNEKGDFLLEDADNKSRIWIANNLIAFNEKNEPYIKNQDNENDRSNVLSIRDISEEVVPETGDQDIQENLDVDTNSEPRNGNGPSHQKCEKNIWSSSDTLALIAAVEARYDDMHHVQKRKHFWSVISEELCGQNIAFTDVTCKKKWLNLVRTYKATKDTLNKTGRGPVKFQYFNRLDELLGDSPANSSCHALDVSELENISGPSNYHSETSGSEESNKKKRKNPSLELVKIKKIYYEEKLEKAREKETLKHQYVEEMLKLKKEKNEMYKRKLNVEEKKLQILENLSSILREKNA